MLCIIYTRPQLCALQTNEKNTDPCPEEAAGGAQAPPRLSLIPLFTHIRSLTTVSRLTQAKCLPLSETSHTMVGHLVGSSLQKYLCAYLEHLAESEISGREGNICRKMRHSFPGYTSTPKKLNMMRAYLPLLLNYVHHAFGLCQFALNQAVPKCCLA